MKITKISLDRVQYIPKDLKPGILYLAEEDGAAAHLCACGCGAKIRTPIHPTEWSIKETKNGPTLFPSVGNWQQPCRSHYWISDGEVRWSHQWTDGQILAGRRGEDLRRKEYYSSLYKKRPVGIESFWIWLREFFRK